VGQVGRLRVGAAVLAALLVAQAAVLVLQPGDGVLAPAAIDPADYFSEAQLDRARAFRRPNVPLVLAVTAIELAVLAWLAARPPARLRRARGVRAGAVVGALLAVLTTLAPLPVLAVLRQRALDVGLSTQSWGGWAQDLAIGTATGAVLGALAGAVAVWLLRRFPRRWWIGGAVAVWLYGAATVALAPLVLDPLHNRFEPVSGSLRADVLRLAERAQVDVGEVLVMDASRRTTAANAYVAGLGATKRVVLYDTLVERFPRREVLSVVAHELGHQRDADLRGGLLFLALVAPAGLYAVALWGRRAPAGPAALPALALAAGVVSFGITAVSNQLSRDVEARADATALELTRDPAAFTAFQQRIAVRNLSDVDPPGWSAFLRTHPTTVERLGFAATWSAAPTRTPGGS
jgi:STE24 endopeptidase